MKVHTMISITRFNTLLGCSIIWLNIHIYLELIAFNEGGAAMRRKYFPVRQYDKVKPANIRVDFFILVDSNYYFEYILDVY